MHTEIQVVIVEDDPYARDLMAMLLARDWRTRVVAEFESGAENDLKGFFSDPLNPVDVVIIDTEVPADPHAYTQVKSLALGRNRPPKLL